ncbi:MAG: hypothetical protein BWY66_02805 [bacterium ADurb.Bin374]|nr:MAG: hypothetical protein BWY66_02805 [bacterium ADurb.Bin374]
MWKLYDDLIEGIPENWRAEEIVRGCDYAYVRSGIGLGMGEFLPNSWRAPLSLKNLEGAPLREVAACIRSWNFPEASIGLAAINAYYNNPDVAKAAGVTIGDSKHVEDRVYDPFIMSQNEVRGKKVTVVGHFPYLETLFEPVCDLRIIAGEIPLDDDYPATAAEYLLPESEYVFIRSAALVDKTMPRLLELSKGAKKVTIVGPATTLAPVLFEYGVADLSGFVVKDRERAMRLIRGAENGKIFTTGQKVAFKRQEFQRKQADLPASWSASTGTDRRP